MTDENSPSNPLKEAAPAIGKALLIIVFPWLLVVVDRYSIREKLGGVRRLNLLWALPLYYSATGIIAAVVLAPALSISGLSTLGVDEIMGAMFVFPLFASAVLITDPGVLISFPNVAVVVGAVGVAVVLGYALTGIGTAAYFRRLAADDEGQMILPVSKIRQQDGLHTKNAPLERSKSILVLGESGSGKTESMRLMVNQMQSEPEEPFVVFDYKNEFREDIFADDEYIHLSLRDSGVKWNLFQEAEDERDLREFGRMLFPEDDESENVFFERGARQIFVAVTRLMYRQFDNPDNAHIQTVFREHTFRTIGDEFDGHPDLIGNIQEYLDEENPRTSQSVFAFVTQTIEDVFIDDFAAESGEFSIREYMADPAGQKLILDIPQQNTQSVAPAFRFFIDQAIKQSLQDGSRNAYFLLDEFARVPSLDQIENLTGAGRAMGAQAILGLQGISQLRRHYDEDYANDILAGVTQEILMRPSDQQTVEHIQSRTGEHEYTTRREKPKTFFESAFESDGLGTGSIQKSYDTRYLIQTSELQRFNDGEAIIMTTDGWQRAQLPMWHQLSKGAKMGLSGRTYTPFSTFRSWGRKAENSHGAEETGTSSTSNGGEPAEKSSSSRDSDGQGTDTDTGGAQASKTESYCPFCGQGLNASNSGNFCPGCGEELPESHA